MSTKEEIVWHEVTERMPEERDPEAWDPEYVMTQDNQGDVLTYCYLEQGVWMTDDKGYEEQIEAEMMRADPDRRTVMRWAQRPKGMPVKKVIR